MGVATDCSTASAEAPGYVPCTRMLGGARNGYCSTASLLTVMVPSITVRIEITMATMGRRIKKFDIAFPYLFLRRRYGLFGGSHQHSGPQPLQSFRYDPV